jgi:hypothetical protein
MTRSKRSEAAPVSNKEASEEDGTVAQTATAEVEADGTVEVLGGTGSSFPCFSLRLYRCELTRRFQHAPSEPPSSKPRWKKPKLLPPSFAFVPLSAPPTRIERLPFPFQPRLPTEVIEMVPALVDDKSTLAACCLVSSSFLRITRPRLYHSFNLELFQPEEHDQWIASNPSTFTLFKTLSLPENFHLCALIHHLTFTIDVYSDETFNNSVFRSAWEKKYGHPSDYYPEDEEGEGVWAILYANDVGHGASIAATLRPIVSNLSSVRSFELKCALQCNLDEVWEDLRTPTSNSPWLESVVLQGCWHDSMRGLRPLDSTVLPALHTLHVSQIKLETEKLDEFKSWCQGRRVDFGAIGCW